MVARARRVAGFGSGVKGWRVGVAVVRGPGAASAHRCLLAVRGRPENVEKLLLYTSVLKIHTAWRSSGTLRRKCSVTDIS